MKKKVKKTKKKEKIPKKKVFVLCIDPYEQELIVVINGHFRDAYKQFKKYDTKAAKETIKHIEENKKDYFEYKETLGLLFTELPSGYVMIINQNMSSWIATTGIVVHEAVHLTHYILERAGFTLTRESQEAYTYLTEKTVEDILRKIY